MTTRPADPRRNARRGSSDASEAGYAIAVEHDQPAVNRGKRWPAPQDIAGITRYQRQRQYTGCCVVCGSPTDADGVTCKAPACVRAWVLSHE